MTKINPGVSNAVAENQTVVESATTQRACFVANFINSDFGSLSIHFYKKGSK